MSSKSSDPQADRPAQDSSRLPFEPTSTRKKTPKKAPAIVPQDSKPTPTPAKPQVDAMPQVVSNRIARRVGFFCGIPTFFGVLTFFASYLIVTQHWFKLPNVAVILVSMGFFGLGVLGLSYGALSASWDEDRLGTWLGWNEFTLNFGRLVESWRSLRQKSDS